MCYTPPEQLHSAEARTSPWNIRYISTAAQLLTIQFHCHTLSIPCNPKYNIMNFHEEFQFAGWWPEDQQPDGILDLPTPLEELVAILYRPPRNIKQQILNEACPYQDRLNAATLVLSRAITKLQSNHNVQQPQYSAWFPDNNPKHVGQRGRQGQQIYNRRTFAYIQRALKARHRQYWERKSRLFRQHEHITDLSENQKTAAVFCLCFHKSLSHYFSGLTNSPAFRCIMKVMALFKARNELELVQDFPLQDSDAEDAGLFWDLV